VHDREGDSFVVDEGWLHAARGKRPGGAVSSRPTQQERTIEAASDHLPGIVFGNKTATDTC
jgi:hypothetical protein